MSRISKKPAKRFLSPLRNTVPALCSFPRPPCSFPRPFSSPLFMRRRSCPCPILCYAPSGFTKAFFSSFRCAYLYTPPFPSFPPPEIPAPPKAPFTPFFPRLRGECSFGRCLCGDFFATMPSSQWEFSLFSPIRCGERKTAKTASFPAPFPPFSLPTPSIPWPTRWPKRWTVSPCA